MATGKHGRGRMRRKQKGDEVYERHFGLASFVLDETVLFRF